MKATRVVTLSSLFSLLSSRFSRPGSILLLSTFLHHTTHCLVLPDISFYPHNCAQSSLPVIVLPTRWAPPLVSTGLLANAVPPFPKA